MLCPLFCRRLCLSPSFRWSVYSTHFNCLVFTRGGGGGGCCDIHASVVWLCLFFGVFFYHSECLLFLIYFFVFWLLLLKKKKEPTVHNLRTCILKMWCCDCAVLASSRPAGLRPGRLPPLPPSVSPTHLFFPTPPGAQDAKRQSFSAIYWT